MSDPRYPGQPGPIGKLLALTAGLVLLVAGFMFSVVILALIALAGAIALGYFWWKTRKLRKAMRQNASGGVVIDGEASVVDDVESTRSGDADIIEDRRPGPRHS